MMMPTHATALFATSALTAHPAAKTPKVQQDAKPVKATPLKKAAAPAKKAAKPKKEVKKKDKPWEARDESGALSTFVC